MAGRGFIPVLTSGQATPPKPYLGMLLKAQKIVRAWGCASAQVLDQKMPIDQGGVAVCH